MPALRFVTAFAAIVFLASFFLASARAQNSAAEFRQAWPGTDFSQRSIDLSEVTAGGPPRDGIPSIDEPIFQPVADSRLAASMPVLSLEINGDARAYPLSILMWHEIVNDRVGGVEVVVTYCPLCNSGAAFRATVDGQALEFGTTGLLRHSDMIMYDRQTESWWQQFTGIAIAGAMTGTELDWIPARMESIDRFRTRFPDGKVLVPNDEDARPYGQNPYLGYDSLNWPFLFRGDFDESIAPLARVVAVGDEAWTLDLVRREGEIEAGDLVITWQAGQSSALDARDIEESGDVGNVVVRRRADGGLEDVAYMVPFVFAFRAFNPEGVIHTEAD